MGRTTLGAALHDERVRLTGTADSVKGFRTWMRWSRFAPASRDAHRGAL